MTLDLLTVAEAAVHEQRGANTILKRIQHGILPAVRLPSGAYRIHKADLTGAPRGPIRLDGYPELLRTTQVALVLRVHHDTVRGWAARKLLPAITTVGGHHRIHRRTVEQLLNTTTAEVAS
ncbi:hypothetical protein GCM10017673_40000 [Streptosporangium violaceochromogenes]|nr:hypothetical protein GCM10017673_40000 [Streptosporangium violaceochromogenes]